MLLEMLMALEQTKVDECRGEWISGCTIVNKWPQVHDGTPTAVFSVCLLCRATKTQHGRTWGVCQGRGVSKVPCKSLIPCWSLGNVIRTNLCERYGEYGSTCRRVKVWEDEEGRGLYVCSQPFSPKQSVNCDFLIYTLLNMRQKYRWSTHLGSLLHRTSLTCPRGICFICES